MRFSEMQGIVKTQMEKQHIPANIIDMSLKMLPTLKRWQGKVNG